MAEFDRLRSQLEMLHDRPGETILDRAQITSVEEVRKLISLWSPLFRGLLIRNGVDPHGSLDLRPNFEPQAAAHRLGSPVRSRESENRRMTQGLEYPRSIPEDNGTEFWV